MARAGERRSIITLAPGTARLDGGVAMIFSGGGARLVVPPDFAEVVVLGWNNARLVDMPHIWRLDVGGACRDADSLWGCRGGAGSVAAMGRVDDGEVRWYWYVCW